MSKELNTIEISNDAVEATAIETIQLDDLSLALVGGGLTVCF